jgi:hypothetical protein
MSRYRVLESEADRRVAGVLVLLAILALGVLRSSAGSRLDSFTVDEPWHIVAGTSYARSGDGADFLFADGFEQAQTSRSRSTNTSLVARLNARGTGGTREVTAKWDFSQ